MAVTTLLEVSHLSKQYRGGVVANDDHPGVNVRRPRSAWRNALPWSRPSSPSSWLRADQNGVRAPV